MTEYDKFYQESETNLLLINIARLEHNEPPHFMMLASINNTLTFGASLASQFGWGAGAKPSKGNSYQAGPFTGTVTESPLFQMVPIQGSDFVNRLYSPLTNQLTYFILRDQYPRKLFFMLGAYLYVIEGNCARDEQGRCIERPETTIGTGGGMSYHGEHGGCPGQDVKGIQSVVMPDFTDYTTYNNDPCYPIDQDHFWYLIQTLDELKAKDQLWLEKLSADLDAGEGSEETTTSPSATEIESATKDSFRWRRESYQLIDKHNVVILTSPTAPSRDQLDAAAKEGDTWIPIDTGKTYELIDLRAGKNRAVIATSDAAPSAADAAAAAKQGFRWVAKVTKGSKYALVHSAQFSDKMFALFDFDINDPKNLPISGTRIREEMQPDPQDFIYVELRHTNPKIKAYIRSRDFVEILQFLAKSAQMPIDSLFPDGSTRQFVGSGIEVPTDFSIEADIFYEDRYLWVPSSPKTTERDRDAFGLLYTLYQMAQIDVSKLPVPAVTIPNK